MAHPSSIIDFLPRFEEFSKKQSQLNVETRFYFFFLQVLTDAPIPMPILPPDLTVREICEGNESRLLELWTVDIVDALLQLIVDTVDGSEIPNSLGWC